MKCLATALGTLLLALAVTPAANAVVRPEWVVVRWAYGDCKIWHNDVNGPAGSGWQAVAFAGSYPEAWAKLQGLYGTRVCVSSLPATSRPHDVRPRRVTPGPQLFPEPECVRGARGIGAGSDQQLTSVHCLFS